MAVGNVHMASPVTTQTALDPENTAGLLHNLHRDEQQLRILAVVLSLTGGLALSFALGVGILVSWYCRSSRHRQTKLRQTTTLLQKAPLHEPVTDTADKVIIATNTPFSFRVPMPNCTLGQTNDMPLPSAPVLKDTFTERDPTVSPSSPSSACERHHPLCMLLPPPAYKA